MSPEEEIDALRARLATVHHYLEPLVGLLRLYRDTPLRPVPVSLLDRADECAEVLRNEAEAAKKWQTEVENHATSAALDAWRKDLMELYMEQFGVAVAMGAFNAGRNTEAGAFRNMAYGIPSDAFTRGSGTNDALRAIVKEALKDTLKDALKGKVTAEVKL